MDTGDAARLGARQQIWRLTAAALIGIAAWFTVAAALPPSCTADTCSWLVTGDPLIALGCVTVLPWRRRFPFTVALVVGIASAASALATGAALLALCSLSTRRRPVEIAVVVAAYVAAAQSTSGLYPIDTPPAPLWLQLALTMSSAGIAVATGVAIDARRAEVRSLRERADSAEREQGARAAQARAQERNRIAREMHDVLAHRISLVAMQAGVLDHRDDLSVEEKRTLVRGIADGSRQALEELRDVLGVLRADPDRPEPPQPTLDRVPDLVADARSSGLAVTLASTVTATPPETVGRTGYRVVQEGLTNATKHAPAAPVQITVDGTPGGELRVSVRNSAAATTLARPPASGFGLLGLAERITLAGGTLDHHRTRDNGYLLTARLPWPEHDPEKRA
ncbi:sensor histidine kinase [Nocardia caishijiensis]|uniref:histidine kinase n=1 Tax=Nocardia caishijiensis TaxID=184756 RepID=A0ABQ6YI32_9NOCA|nr:histidine kinase [Nocardia caishijiensis]KAF0845131.1 signal transduction histidine kinase [Nocardia caishijiensis]